MGALQFGRIDHRFEAVEAGTRYRVTTLPGPDLPGLGPQINLYITRKRFPEPMLSQWLRHQVEGVGALRYFLPELYRQKVEPTATAVRE